MGKQPMTARGIATRRQIVDAAAQVVAENGASGASLDEIGARAAASRSQLYHYFQDKADLLRAVAEATNDAVLGGQRDLFAELGSWDGLTRWADTLVALQEQHGGRGGCPIANLLAQAGERDEDLRSVLASGYDRWQASIRDGLAAMVTTGELRPDTDVDWLATCTLASLQGGLTLTQARRDPTTLRRALDGALVLIAAHNTDAHRAGTCAVPRATRIGHGESPR